MKVVYPLAKGLSSLNRVARRPRVAARLFSGTNIGGVEKRTATAP